MSRHRSNPASDSTMTVRRLDTGEAISPNPDCLRYGPRAPGSTLKALLLRPAGVQQPGDSLYWLPSGSSTRMAVRVVEESAS